MNVSNLELLGLVGIGGYLLQGGISFLSAQYGLAADVSFLWLETGPDANAPPIRILLGGKWLPLTAPYGRLMLPLSQILPLLCAVVAVSLVSPSASRYGLSGANQAKVSLPCSRSRPIRSDKSGVV